MASERRPVRGRHALRRHWGFCKSAITPAARRSSWCSGPASWLLVLLHIRSVERAGKEPLLSTSLFHNRNSNLGLVTQNVQWLLPMGSSFVVSVYLQVRAGAQRDRDRAHLHPRNRRNPRVLARSRTARQSGTRSERLIRAGFIVTLAGIGLLLGLVEVTSGVWTFVSGLLFLGLGLGAMLTPSVNVVQSSVSRRAPGRNLGPLAQLCPTSARRWGQRSPARFSSPSSPAATSPTRWRWVRWH